MLLSISAISPLPWARLVGLSISDIKASPDNGAHWWYFCRLWQACLEAIKASARANDLLHSRYGSLALRLIPPHVASSSRSSRTFSSSGCRHGIAQSLPVGDPLGTLLSIFARMTLGDQATEQTLRIGGAEQAVIQR
jgi:hypothetical protein